jgi:uncharacterized membrane protein YbaN (DUF454 family)
VSPKTLLLCGTGFLMLGMGAVGLVLPIWPTTPFVLLAAGCFASTPRLYARMLKIPFFNEYIRNYRERKGLRPRTVAISLVFLWSMLLVSALHIRALWAAVLLGLVGAAVTVHIVWIARARH